MFSGHTGPSDAVISLARGADLLMHEVMDFGALPTEGFPAGLGAVFRRGAHRCIGRGAGRRGGGRARPRPEPLRPRLAHRPPRWAERIGKDYDGRVIVAKDLMSIPVRGGQEAS
jgi:hypothetical protein